MSKVTRLICLLLIILLLGQSAFALTPSDWSAEHPETLHPDMLFAQTAVIIDQKTGDILFSKGADVRMYPASLTKIMTLMLAIESGISLDTMISIPAEAANIPKDSSVIPVSVGEEMSFGDLLYGFMMCSGNDGAIAIAIIVSGTVDRFVQQMNDRAIELGCVATHFVNPHGYHDANHYTTANDIAKISRQAMTYPVFREIVATPEYTLAATNKHKMREIKSRVELLLKDSKYYYSKCTGIKTGYHANAGQCIVASAKWGDRTVIAVCMKSTVYYVERKWYDAARMLEYSKTCYNEYTIRQLFDMASPEITSINVENASQKDPYGGELSLLLSQTSNDAYTLMVLEGSDELADNVEYFNTHTTITLTTDYQDKIAASETIEAGSIIGQLTFNAEDGEVITGNLIASRTVEVAKKRKTFNEYLTENYPAFKFISSDLFLLILGVVLVIAVVIIVAMIARSARRARRRKRIYEQRRRDYNARRRSASRRSTYD